MWKWLFRVLPFIYMGVIWTLSSLPHNAVVELPDSTIDRFFKESMHLVEFAILYVLFVLGALTWNGSFSKKVNYICAAIACLYGITDEIHQSFVPYRSATVIDVIKDITGVVVCWYFIDRALFQQRFPKMGAMLRLFQKKMRSSRK
ncbi:VanZ family protein [Cytobacillus eiseniae]|uniref:VanZ family protein n=1 Tax=Cytobacillus eiseniae TaxID=762947 RepID=A0ABS4RJC8_9BACI|nr:VanZ family protein [Cytobacillus eiseniae]MBP2242399.1 VanZ family protein [Cytobacillus eiseniae]